MLRGARSDRFIRTAGDLQAELAALDRNCRDAGRRGLFEMKSQGGHVLGIVLGDADSSLSFGRADGEPPYFASEGSARADEPVFTAYLDLHHETEFPRWSVIPVQAALEAASEFLETGQRPARVSWRQV